MSRLLLCVAALLGFVFPVQAQPKIDVLPSSPLARLGETRYQNVGRVFSLAFAPSGKTLLAGAWDGSIRLWNVATGKEIREYSGHEGWVRSVSFSPDGKTFASGGKDKIIRLWETETGKELRRFEGHQNWIQYLAFSPDGKMLASRSTGSTIRLWDVADGRELRQLKLQPYTPSSHASFAFSPDEKTLAYPANTRSIALFDLSLGKEVRRIMGQPYWYGSLAFSPDGTILADMNGPPQFWQVSSGKELRPLKMRKNNPIWNFLFSPDGRLVATAEGGYSLIIWEMASRRERCRFLSTDKQPSVLAFSPDGRTLAQGSEDVAVLLWDVTGLQGNIRPRPTSISAKELQALWQELASEDAAAAYRAIGKLAAGAKDSVPFFREHLRAVPSADERAISQHVADLDSARFETRENANERLEKMSKLAEPALRRALRDNPQLERRKRIERLLERVEMQRENPTPDRLRMLRAVEVLEHMDTNEARLVLEEYAKGAPGAGLTNEAIAALKRLAKRRESEPRP